MATRFYITPYDPEGWRDPDVSPTARPKSDLHIMTRDFNEQLRQRWHEAETFPIHAWEFTYADEQGVSGSFSGEGNQILTLTGGRSFNEFVFWYRSYISANYPLFLFPEGEWASLELTLQTRLEDIAKFTGL